MPKTRQSKMQLPKSGTSARAKKTHEMYVATVTEEGDFNQPVPHMGMARLILVIFIIHAVVIGGIIGYDRLGGVNEPASSSRIEKRPAATGALPPTSVSNAVLEKTHPIEDYATYEWRSNDSLPKVAEKLRVTEQELIRLNMLDKGVQVGPGTILRYPRQPVLKAVGIGSADIPAANTLMDRAAPAPGTMAAAAAPSIGLELPGESGFSLSPNIMNELAAAPDLSPRLEVISLAEESPPASTSVKAEPAPTVAPITKADAPPAVVAKVEPAPPAPQVEKPVIKALPYTPPAPPQVKKAAPKAPEVKPVIKAPAKAAPKATATSHTVRPGENLYRIASKYKVSVKAIQDANRLKDANNIRDGTKLIIPAR